MADGQAKSGHGGRREGAGRKPKAEEFAGEIGSVRQRIAGKSDALFDALLLLALGGAEREEREYVCAAMVTIERKTDVLDKDGFPTGKLTKWKEPAFPNLTPEAMVLVKRKVVTLEPDTKAAMYLLDRIMGKPASEDESERYAEIVAEARAKFLAAVAGLEPEQREQIAAQLEREE